MKKLVLTTVCALAMAGVAFAQGDVNWSGFSSTAMSGRTNTITYSPFFGGGATGIAGATQGMAYEPGQPGTGFYWELLYSTYTGSQASVPSSFSGFSGWLDTGLGATNSTLSFVAGSLVAIAPTTQATVPWASGTTDSIVMVGWSANLGTSWGTVSNLLASGNYISQLAGQNGFFGVSATGYIAPNAANPGVTLFATSAASYGLPINSPNTALYLLPVPEPGTLALAGLGGLSLLLFRRQRK